MSASTPCGSLRELARRSSDGLEVALFRDRTSNTLTVCVGDEKRGTYLELHPRAEHALDCFYHPYSYAGAEDVDEFDVLAA